jgi:hypothetical protein
MLASIETTQNRPTTVPLIQTIFNHTHHAIGGCHFKNIILFYYELR